MKIRRTCLVVLLAVAGGIGWLPVGLAEESAVAKFFRDEPADSLVRKLDVRGHSGLVVAQEHRPASEPGVLVIDTTISNPGEATVKVESITLADWQFRIADDPESVGYRKLTYRHDTWYDSTFWTGPGWTRVGDRYHHPGVNTPSVRRFRVPRDGRIKITGRVYKLHEDAATDGVRLLIRHAGQDVWQAEIDGADAKGVEPNVTLDVKTGDSIRFVVHKRVNIACDTTYWDPVITYADGESFQASKSFSTSKQGLGGWFYEMQSDPASTVGLPTLYGFGREVELKQSPVGVEQPVSLTGAQDLPIFALADDEDQSGVLLVMGDGGAWQLHSVMTSKGQLELRLSIGDAAAPIEVLPGQSVRLPQLVMSTYRGSFGSGMIRLQQVLDIEALKPLRQKLAATGCGQLDLWAMVQSEWQREDGLDGSAETLDAAIALHLEKAGRLVEDLRMGRPGDFLAVEVGELERMAAVKVGSLQSRKRLYMEVRRLKRRIALANPLLDFDRIVFTKRVPTSYSHQVMQYYGWRARPGGGIFVLEKPGYSLAARDILAGKLEGGNVLEPRLSYDGKRIVFAYVECREQTYLPEELNINEQGPGDCYYHLYEVNVGGTGRKQLPFGPYDDPMPAYLPDGGIAFCSTRRKGYARCFGGQFSRRWDTYTLHRMDADGSNIRTLSFHDTNEWFPAVDNSGHILYARWDYIDRDAVTHQNLWSSRPDGTNPTAVWGNGTPKPHCTFQIQPIPDSTKIAFTASAHHSIAGGSIALVDPTVNYDGQEAITRITPEVPFPEAESFEIPEYYASPWPLSEKYFLAAYSPTKLVFEPGANLKNALGVYLLDAQGNRELIYRDPAIGSTNPCPLRGRPTPPVLPSMLPEDAAPVGEMIVSDIYEGLGNVPRGSIKELRVVQIFPKTTPIGNTPNIGIAGEENARAILGAVPVEPDGSVRFVAPARKLLLFQALDADGFAYQTMRSVTYLQPGERVSCVGCHENRMTAPVDAHVMALSRPPSQIIPGELGGRPFSYVEVVQPVLDKHCVRCHGGEKIDGDIDLTGTPQGGYTRSYLVLCGDEQRVPRFKARNQIQVTPPGGQYGALGSGLMRLLRAGHEDVQLSPADIRRLAAWIDLNAIFYGVNLPEDQARQLRGEVVAMPQIQ